MTILLGLNCVFPSVVTMAAVPEAHTKQAAATLADKKHDEADSHPYKKVFPVDTHAFFRVEPDGITVVFADLDTGDAGYIAVPSAYIKGSPYNEKNVSYGIYMTKDGRAHFVDLQNCFREKDGSYTFRYGTSDGATVSGEVDTATTADPTMGPVLGDEYIVGNTLVMLCEHIQKSTMRPRPIRNILLRGEPGTGKLEMYVGRLRQDVTSRYTHLRPMP